MGKNPGGLFGGALGPFFFPKKKQADFFCSGVFFFLFVATMGYCGKTSKKKTKGGRAYLGFVQKARLKKKLKKKKNQGLFPINFPFGEIFWEFFVFFLPPLYCFLARDSIFFQKKRPMGVEKKKREQKKLADPKPQNFFAFPLGQWGPPPKNPRQRNFFISPTLRGGTKKM